MLRKIMKDAQAGKVSGYLMMVIVVVSMTFGVVKILESTSRADGCDFNYAVSEGSVHLHMAGYGCLPSSIHATGEDVNVILSVDPQGSEGFVQASLPAGTVYDFTVHFVDSDGRDITRRIDNVREGDSQTFST